MDSPLRDKWLSSEDSVFLRDCDLSAFRVSGHGGQKVNKTSSAVCLTHRPSNLSASAQESRSQTENRLFALRRLKIKIALEIRGDTMPPSLACIPAERNPSYPFFVAALFDTLHKAGWELKGAAALFGVSPSKLAKELYRRPDLWQELGRRRAESSLAPLKTP